MSFQQFLAILWARKWIVQFTLLVTVATAVALSLLLPPRYTATTTLVIDYKALDPVTGALLPAQLMPGYMATQVGIIQSHNVGVKVVNNLKLAQIPAMQEEFLSAAEGKGRIEDWLAELLIKYLSVEPSREASIINVSYTGNNPDFAAAIANAFARAYIDTNLELRVEPAKQMATWFDGQIATLRENLEKAQARLSAHQREKGIHAADERLDVENAKLQELSQQLVIAEAQVSDTGSRKRQLDGFITSGQSPESLPDVLANPLVSSLKNQLSAAASRLNQVSGQLGPNHPEVQRATAEVQSLRAKLNEEIQNAAAGITNQYRIATARAAELRRGVEQQKQRLLTGNIGRDEMAVMIKEVETAQRALDTASLRFTQTNLEGQITQSNIAVLNPAIPPLNPSFPKLLLNTALAVVLGGILGVGFAFLREMMDRRVRSLEDLIQIEGMPVLAVLSKAPKRRRFFGLFGRRAPAPAPA